MKTAKSIILVLVTLTMVMALSVPAFAGPFADVPSDHWAYDAVARAFASGIVEGYPDQTFKGQQNITRYEVSMIIERMLDKFEIPIDELRAEVDDIDAFVASALAEIDAQAAQIEALEADVDELKALTAEFAVELQRQEEIEELRAELEDIGRYTDALSDLTLEHIANLSDVQTNVEGLLAAYAELEEEVGRVVFSGTSEIDFEDVSVDAAVILPEYYEDPFDDDDDYEQGSSFEKSLDLDMAIRATDDVLVNIAFESGFDLLDSAGFDLGMDSFSFLVDTPSVVFDAGTGRALNYYTVYAFGDEDLADDPYMDGVKIDTKNRDFSLFFGSDDGIDDYYVLATRYGMGLAGIDLGLGYYSDMWSAEATGDEAQAISRIIGLDAAMSLAGFDVAIDFAQAQETDVMAVEDGNLLALDVSRDLSIVDLSFGYSRVEQDFTPLYEDDDVYTMDVDDIHDGMFNDIEVYNLTLSRSLMGFDAGLSIAGASQIEGDMELDRFKVTVARENLLLSGLGLDFAFFTLDPTNITADDATETVIDLGLEFVTLDDYLVFGLDYETRDNLAFNDGMEQDTLEFSVDLDDYPIMSSSVFRAGFEYEDVSGDVPNLTRNAFSVGTTYSRTNSSFLFDYIMGNAEGDDLPGEYGWLGLAAADTEANYNRIELGFNYSLLENTLLELGYAITDFEAETGGADYTTTEINAGISVDF